MPDAQQIYDSLVQSGDMFEELFTNFMMLALQLALFVYLTLSLIKMYANRKNIRLARHLTAILGLVFVWALISVLRYFVGGTGLIYLLSLLPYAFATFSLVTVFFFVLRFYNLLALCKPHIVLVFLVIPTVTVICASLGLHLDVHLLRVDPVVNTIQLNYVFGEFDSWFYVQFYFSLFLACGVTAVSVVQHIKLPKIYRAPSEKLLTGAIMVTVFYLIALLNLTGRESFPLDFALLGFIFAARSFYASTLGNQGMVFLSQARNDIIQNLDQSILILNDEKDIIFKNVKATQWLDGLKFTGNTYSLLTECLAAAAVKSEKLRDEEGGTDYHFDSKGRLTIFNLREKIIQDNQNRQIGTYVVYSDETENRQLIQRLEVGAGRDALTGLHNRSMMESLKKEMDKPDSLPLALLICDLNNLKTTNDVHGHQSGDIMLRVCGEALTEKCPPTAQCGRIGGDEFLVLLPNTGKLEAESVIEGIREYLNGITEYPFPVTMAMGSGVKEQPDDDIGKTMITADEAMYANKKVMKGLAEIRGKTDLI